MASTYSTNLKIELMATGENSGSWGTTTNTNLGTALEQSIVGYGNPSYPSDANLTITLTDSNASQAARALVLNVTSAVSLTVTRELVVPTIQKQYIVQNNTTGAQSITVKTSAGTGITVPNGRKAHLYVDGTNVIQMFDFVDINGGTIDNATVGATTASSGAFTTLGATGNVTLGDASADTVTVNGTTTFVTKPTVQLTSAATNTVTQVMRLDSQSSGTPAAGIGVGLEFAVETAAANTEVGATLEAVTTDVTAASEDFDLLVKLMIAGAAAAEVARFKSTGLSLVTGDTYQINGVDVLSATALGAGILGATQTFTAAQTFRAANAVRSEAAATQDAIILAGRAGGTGSFAVTLIPTTLSASRTITLPDGDVTISSGTGAVLGTAQTFTAAQTFRAASAVRSEAAATQDAVVLAGRGGGTSSYAVSLTPTTLSANRTLTLPNVTDTVAVLGTAQTFSAATTFSSTVTMSGTTTNISIGTSQTSGTLTLGGTAQTGTLTLGQSTGAQTINIGTGVNTSATKTINIGTGSTGSGVTDIDIGPSDATSQVSSDGLLNLRGLWAARSAVQGENGFTVENAPTGSYIAPASVSIDAYTSANNAGTYTAPYLAGYINWVDTNTDATGAADFFIKTRCSSVNAYSLYHSPVNNQVSVGVGGSDANSVQSLGQYSVAIGPGASSLVSSFSGSPLTPSDSSVAVGYRAGAHLSTSASSQLGTYNVAIGNYAGYLQAQNTSYVSYSSGVNVSIGESAGSTLSSGTAIVSGVGHNVCIGTSAGYGNFSQTTTNGNTNTFVGYHAGYNPQYGLNNCTFIGANAGSGLLGVIYNDTYDAVILGGYTGASGVGNGAVIISNGLGDVLFSGNSASGSVVKFDSILLNLNLATTLRSTGGISFYDSEFKIIDNTDTTKVVQFDAATVATGTTRTFTLPNASGTVALTSGTQTFSGSTTFSSTFTLSGTTTNISLGTSQSSGTMTMGGTAGTGTITLGRSTGAQTLSLAGGATTSATTKTVDIGTAGVSGSITNINIGSAVVGATGTITMSLPTVLPAGTAALSPFRMTSGTVNTTPVAGVVEYDGTVFYGTADTTSGRGLWPTVQYFRLTADGSAIGPGIANFYGATSGKSLDTSSFYEVEYELYFTKTTAGTLTFTMTFANAPINCNANYVGTPVGGVGTVGAPQTAALVKSTATASALPVTGSLTTGVNHQYTVKAIFQANATTGGTLNLQVTSSAGTVTPLTGSYYKVTRLPAANTGAFS